MTKYRKKPVVIEAFQITQQLAIDNLIDDKPLPFPELGIRTIYTLLKR